MDISALKRGIVTAVTVVLGLCTLSSGLLAHAAGETVDEIHYSFGNTPDTVVFDWRGQEQHLYYGLTSSYGQTAVAIASTVTPVDSVGPFQEVQIGGLQPGAVYHYKIGTTGLDHTFQTIPTGDFTWVDMGDTGSTLCSPWVAQIHSLVAAQNPNFVTHGGDISYANVCGVGAVHQYYVDQQAWAEGAAFQPAWGNHEYGQPASTAPVGTPRDSLENYKGRSFITNAQTAPSDTTSQVNSPGCGWATSSTTNTCRGEDWGWFQAGHVLFISYPEPWPNAYPAWQTSADTLMARAQADTSIEFIVTYGHRPPYSSVSTEIDPNLRGALNSLALKYSPSAGNPTGKYVLNVDHHVHWEEVFRPINGLVNITDGGGGAGQISPTSFDSNSIFHVTHPAILSASYSASQHTLTVNLVCGPAYAPAPKTTCTYGSSLYTQTFTRPDGSPSVPAQLSTTLTDNNPTPQVGQQITYTVSVANQAANSVAQGISTTISLPANLTIVNANNGTVNGNGVTWNVGSLNGGQAPVTEQVVAQLASGNPGASLVVTATTTDSDGSCQTNGSVCSATDTDTIAATPSVHQWIANQSVETDLTGWTGTYGSSPYVAVTRDTSVGHSGTTSIRVSGLPGATNLSSGFNDNPRWVTSTSAGLTYTQSAWIKPSFVGQKLTMRLREWRGATLVTDKVTALTAATTNWQQLTQTLTAAGSGNQLSFAVYGSSLSAGQWFNADDFSLTTPN